MSHTNGTFFNQYYLLSHGLQKIQISRLKKKTILRFHEKSGQSRFIWGATISRSCYHEISAQCHLSQNIKSFQTFFFCLLLTFFNGKIWENYFLDLPLLSSSLPILSYCAVLFQMLKQLCGIGSSATAQSRNKRKQKPVQKTSSKPKLQKKWKCWRIGW